MEREIPSKASIPLPQLLPQLLPAPLLWPLVDPELRQPRQ